LTTIDWDVVDGIRLSAAHGIDLESWSNLREYVNAHFFDVGEPSGFLNRLVGYVGEAKAGDFFDAQGVDVTFNEAPNLPGYDISVDGSPIQVKVGGTSDTFSHHFEKYPDIPIVTGPDNLDIVPGGMDVSFIDSLDADQIRAATEQSMDIVHDDFHSGGSTIPAMTVIMASLREIGLLVDGHTNISSAAKNIGLDAAGVGVGGWAGAQAGALIGSVFGPAGSAVGAILGAIGGANLGRSVSNEFKYADLKARAGECEQIVLRAQEQVRTSQAKAYLEVVDEVNKHERAIRQFIEVIHRNLKAKLENCSHWHDGRCVAFVKLFPKVLERVELAVRKRRQAVLSKLKRSSLLYRFLWPQLEDIRYVVLKRSFRNKLRRISASRSHFARLSSRTPLQIQPREAIQRIEKFVQDNPFESPDFDHLCRQLKEVTQSVHERQKVLQDQAKALCQQEYSKHLSAVRQFMHKTASNLSDLACTQAIAVSEAKDRLLKEARKVGIDLESSQA
jgi:uncharacterized membrane protein